MNPLSESSYGTNSGYLAHDGPASLVPAARRIGAHIYIANVGGPGHFCPGGDATQQEQYSPLNMFDTDRDDRCKRSRISPLFPVDGPSTDRVTFLRISNIADDPRQPTELTEGFSNSFKDLAAQNHRDLDNNYSLDFDLTPEDQDQEPRSVEVSSLFTY